MSEYWDIRASMLDNMPDCNLRAIVAQYPQLVEEKTGLVLSRPTEHVGAAIGTSLHAAAQKILMGQAKLDDGLDIAIKQFDIQTAEGWTTDNITGNRDVAVTQMMRMLKAWHPVSLTYKAREVELDYGYNPEHSYMGRDSETGELSILAPAPKDNRVDLGGGFAGSGHIDVVTVDDRIIDHKFGKNSPYAMRQLGLYSLLHRTKTGATVRGLEQHWTPRVSKLQPQPATAVSAFDVTQSEKMARHAIDDVKRIVTKFAETGDIYAIQANNKSKMCSDKFCPAWGTEACKVWGA